MSLDPARAAVRVAVRRVLGDLEPGSTVLVACSGGADSLALLSASVFEGHKDALRVVGVTVDHGLQQDSAELTDRVVAQMVQLGVDETASIRVTVDPGPAGIEAGAREARYAALSALAEHFGASVVLLGHTLDDQAETVLLGLTRGSGGRSLQGMRRSYRDVDQRVTFARPLLDLTRAQTEAACRAEQVTWWEDPQNADPRFTRTRVRKTVLPMLERELGPGVTQALARTGEMLRADLDALDDLAGAAFRQHRVPDGLSTEGLDELATALLTRVVRMACIEAGAIPSELTREHVLGVADLVQGPRDQRQIQLPGHVTAYREGGVLRFRRTAPPPN